jgi:hypothetical protein
VVLLCSVGSVVWWSVFRYVVIKSPWATTASLLHSYIALKSHISSSYNSSSTHLPSQLVLGGYVSRSYLLNLLKVLGGLKNIMSALLCYYQCWVSMFSLVCSVMLCCVLFFSALNQHNTEYWVDLVCIVMLCSALLCYH